MMFGTCKYSEGFKEVREKCGEGVWMHVAAIWNVFLVRLLDSLGTKQLPI